MSRLPTGRARLAFVAVAVLLALAGAAAFVLLRDDEGTSKQPVVTRAPPVTDAGRPYPGGDPTADLLLPPDDQLFGFSGAPVAPAGTLSREFDIGATPEKLAADVAAGGADTFRFVVGWIDAEPQRGQMNAAYLAFVDRIVGALRRVGVKPLFVLESIPVWALASPGDNRSGVREGREVDAAFAGFAGLVAKRWPNAAGIETANEPNVGAQTRPGRSPERYTALHRAAAAAIREAAPGLPVVLAGLAGTDGSVADTMRAQVFLKRMYAAGLRPADYDALALHPYPGQHDGRMDPLGEGSYFAAELADFRAGFRWIDPDARVWITEVGLSTSGGAALSPRRQARDLLPLVRQLSSMVDVDAVLVHTVYDLPAKPPADGERGFGVMIPHRTGPNEPKPALCALNALAVGLPRAPGCA